MVLAQREGFQAPSSDEFLWPCVTPELDLFGVGVCLNRVAILYIVAAVVTLGFFVFTFRRLRLVPSKGQSLGEMSIDFVRSMILDVIGPQGLRFLPYLTTIFFFIFFGNLLAVIPGINYSPNSSTAIPAFLAVLTWFIFNIVGIRAHGWRYFKNALFPPGVPAFTHVLGAPIEFVSVFLVRPVTLTIRLAANMIAGHLMLLVFLLGAEYMLEPLFHGELSITNLWAVGSFAFAIALIAFEALVAGLQAYIFTILTATYIAGALESEH